MNQKPAVMNPGNMISATERAKSRVQSWIDLAAEVTSDARKDARLKQRECKACFYAPRIGGAAVTSRPCMCCGKDQLYGSTATDVLCMECSTKHRLCKHCGGDLEMKARRKAWPAPDRVPLSEECPVPSCDECHERGDCAVEERRRKAN